MNEQGSGGRHGGEVAGPDRVIIDRVTRAAQDLRPMLASLSEAPLDDPHLVYEPKYDGIRAIVEIDRSGRVRLWSRLGNDKTRQFPEIASALEAWVRHAQHAARPLVIDGEIVALDPAGEPAGFQYLQGRIHLEDAGGRTAGGGGGTAFIAFDLLRAGQDDLRDRPLLERRTALERLFGRTRSPLLRLSEFTRGDGRALYERALSKGWEGLIAKHADSPYKSGKRTPHWRKLKILQEQEFVIGGWTEPRQTRAWFGALLLGVYDGPTLVYVGHTGTGFNQRELARVMGLLKPLETRACPFGVRPKTNERPHWVEPRLVAQIKFTEWTADARLRHPVYLGLRDDKRPEDVHREPTSRLHATSSRLQESKSDPRPAHPNGNPGQAPAAVETPLSRKAAAEPAGMRDTPPAARGTRPAAQARRADAHPHFPQQNSRMEAQAGSDVLDQLQDIERSRRDGVLHLPDGDRLSVSNLHKVFWPKQKLTKGDLIRYYVQVAPFILPAVADRPLVMKRLPNGIHGKAFYQQRAPDDVPDGVRVEQVRSDQSVPSRLIGGTLKTLLYMTQLAAISQDPWFSRADTPTAADHAALDLDPMPGVGFARVLDVARWIRDELDRLGATGVPKTSGAEGLHIYLPLPPGTPYEAGLLLCQIIATVVAHKHPKDATVERAVRARGRRVYIDYLQNILGKTLATAYSARASDYAGVSIPLTWDEVSRGVEREDFTIETVPARLGKVGDLWKRLRTSKGIDLSRIERYARKL